MTIETKKIKIEAIEYVSFTCDKCKKTYDYEDWIEWQEKLSYDLVGGYGCVYGDGVSMKFDICQHCLYELVKDFARFE